MRKNIDLSEEAVEVLTIQAIKKKTVFKLHVEDILENIAKPFIDSEKATKTKPKS